MNPHHRLCIVLVGTALAGGCASEGTRPTEEMTRARTVVDQAARGNAARYAAADLQRARDELDSANRADGDRKFIDARRWAERAEADASLAMAKGNSGEARQSEQQVRQGIDSLRSEAGRANAGAAARDPGMAPPPAPPVPEQGTDPANPDPLPGGSTANPSTGPTRP